MNKICILILLTLFNIKVIIASEYQKISQQDSCILINGVNFQGTLFQEDYIFDLSPDNSKKLTVRSEWYLKKLIKDTITSWTPKVADIHNIESKIPELLNVYSTRDEYIIENLPEIIDKIDKYKRQYIGYKDCKNNKCLWIQFVYSEIKTIQPNKSITRILGGGTTCFLLLVDLEENKIKKLLINGPI